MGKWKKINLGDVTLACEKGNGCPTRTRIIILSPEEFDKVKRMRGKKQVNAIIQMRIGNRSFCEKHRKEFLQNSQK